MWQNFTDTSSGFIDIVVYKKVSWRCPKTCAKTEKKFLKTHAKKSRNVSAKNHNDHFWLFHRPNGIFTLFSEPEPRKLERNTTCPWKIIFLFFVADFLATKSFRHGQLNPWATTYPWWKVIGPMGNCWKFLKVFKRSEQITKFQSVSAKKQCWPKIFG